MQNSIVLVHGLFGHPKKTWTLNKAPNTSEEIWDDDSDEDGGNRESTRKTKRARFSTKELFSEVFWPRDLLPQVFPKARILTWGYDVQIEQMLSAASKASIFHHAETLLSDLVMARKQKGDRKKPLFFIAHSLGGIVVKDALSLSGNEKTFLNEILPATKGVMFLGTPHHGTKIATLGKIAFELSKVLLKRPNLQVLRGLEANSETLERIARSFGQVLSSGQIKVHSFREELDTAGVTIVDANSATIGYLNETRGSLHANHRNMAKFSSINDTKFQRLASVLERWINDMDDEQSQTLERSALNLPDWLIFDEQYQACLQSLNNPQARKRLEDVEVAYGETYDWLFSDKLSFTQWLDGTHSSPIYWIAGKPGSGKSTMMKHAMYHSLTQNYLRNYHQAPWVITGYFFHDRGSADQKSVEGFLREILYQILYQRKETFKLVFPLFNQRFLAPSQLQRGPTSASCNAWSSCTIQDALLSIATKTEVGVNICLFIDALDEHDGNHNDLVSTLSRLAQRRENPLYRLRLCLACRPENVFKDAFGNCPGFLIHEQTTNDIKRYAEGRIQAAIGGRFSEKGEQELNDLLQKIIEKANGVFLWVRLVVDELLEGLCEGDSIQELDDILSTIPTELRELYLRTLRRTRRTSASTQAKTRYEAYVMFQIAVSSRTPFFLYDFLSAALFLSTGRGTYPELQRLSESQMERRLYSRSSGLLEATSSGGRAVQFIHQTVKEFMIDGSGRVAIHEGIESRRQENGYLLIFRYILHQFDSFKRESEDVDGKRFVARTFVNYAQILELDEDICIAKYLEPALSDLSDLVEKNILTEIASSRLELQYGSNIPLNGDRRRIERLRFYMICGLPLSLHHNLPLHCDDLTAESSHHLLEFAFKCASSLMHKNLEPSYQIIRNLLDAGVGFNITTSDFKSLDLILQKLLSHRDVPSNTREEILELWDSLRKEKS